jgi:hypothetical protein
MSSLLNVAFHDSAAALLKGHVPVSPTEDIMRLQRQASRNARPAYCLPRVGVEYYFTDPGLRLASATASAPVTSSSHI